MANTVYIAGKISGDPNYKEKFTAAQKQLEAEGYIVLNPAWLPSEGFEYEAYIRIADAMLVECEQIVLLPGYRESKGAYHEYILAKAYGKEVRFLEEEHGKWVNQDAEPNQNYKMMYSWYCSNCGAATKNKKKVFKIEMPDRCPNCGAKMDGDTYEKT